MSDDPKIVDAEVIENSTIGEKQAEHLKGNLLSADSWLRGLYMMLFAAIACVAGYVAMVLIVIQFIFALITGASDNRLQQFGKNLSTYLFQILCFLTYNSEDKPFPFMDWPSSDEEADDNND